MPVRGVTSGRKVGLRYNGIPVVGFIHKGTAEKIKGKKGAILKRLFTGKQGCLLTPEIRKPLRMHCRCSCKTPK